MYLQLLLQRIFDKKAELVQSLEDFNPYELLHGQPEKLTCELRELCEMYEVYKSAF